MNSLSQPSFEPSFLASLLQRIDEGDEAALRSLFDHTKSTLSRVVRALVRRDHDVEEVMLDVYEQVWKQAGRFDRALGSARTWLVVIARSRALDYLRAQRTREARRVAASFEREFAQETDPADECAQVEERERVTSALDELSPHQRQTIRAVFFEGLSHSEAAERLHVPLGTVKSRVRRGLEALEVGLRAQEASATRLNSPPAEDRAS